MICYREHAEARWRNGEAEGRNNLKKEKKNHSTNIPFSLRQLGKHRLWLPQYDNSCLHWIFTCPMDYWSIYMPSQALLFSLLFSLILLLSFSLSFSFPFSRTHTHTHSAFAPHRARRWRDTRPALLAVRARPHFHLPRRGQRGLAAAPQWPSVRHPPGHHSHGGSAPSIMPARARLDRARAAPTWPRGHTGCAKHHRDRSGYVAAAVLKEDREEENIMQRE